MRRQCVQQAHVHDVDGARQHVANALRVCAVAVRVHRNNLEHNTTVNSSAHAGTRRDTAHHTPNSSLMRPSPRSLQRSRRSQVPAQRVANETLVYTQRLTVRQAAQGRTNPRPRPATARKRHSYSAFTGMLQCLLGQSRRFAPRSAPARALAAAIINTAMPKRKVATTVPSDAAAAGPVSCGCHARRACVVLLSRCE